MTTRRDGGELGERERRQRPDVDDERHDREEEDHHLRIAERQRQRAEKGAPAARGGRRPRLRARPGAVAILQATVEEIGGAGEFQRDEQAGEGVGEHAEARSPPAMSQIMSPTT